MSYGSYKVINETVNLDPSSNRIRKEWLPRNQRLKQRKRAKRENFVLNEAAKRLGDSLKYAEEELGVKL